jgi:hypothetical protein
VIHLLCACVVVLSLQVTLNEQTIEGTKLVCQQRVENLYFACAAINFLLKIVTGASSYEKNKLDRQANS